MTCQQCRDRIIAALYNELSGDEKIRFESHLGTCKECSRMYAEMDETLRIMDKRERVEPEDTSWSGYEDRIMEKIRERELPAPGKEREKFAFRGAWVPSWAYGIAALLLITIGIFLGRSLFVNQVTAVNPEKGQLTSSVPVTSDTINAAVLPYLERSRNVLLGIINTDETTYSQPVFEQQQRVSRQLIQQGAVIRAALKKPDQQQVRQLVQDLEVILLQLANIEVKPGVPVVELVRKGVDRNSILLKINLEEMKVKSDGTPSTKKKTKYRS